MLWWCGDWARSLGRLRLGQEVKKALDVSLPLAFAPLFVSASSVLAPLLSLLISAALAFSPLLTSFFAFLSLLRALFSTLDDAENELWSELSGRGVSDSVCTGTNV